ncbi:MAG: hypothetical protein ABA06_01795 [Parcubacteria bacterium C7867-001]|nr:MAG: hypothetical protein ABA06_01795 [Parcubacteria bacterium C7867-001]
MGKSRIFFIFLFVLFICSVAATYYRYVVLQDYVIFTNEDDIPNEFDPLTYTSI